MPRLSRTSSASSQSYTTLPSSVDTHQPAVAYYTGHTSHTGHAGHAGHAGPTGHSRMASMSSSSGNSAPPAPAYYSHIPDGLPSPSGLTHDTASGAGLVVGSQVMPAPVGYAHDALAVGMPGSVGPVGGVGGVGGVGVHTGGLGSYQVQMPHQQSQSHSHAHQLRTSSGAWTPQDDDTLLAARARGENWAMIHTQFTGKTPNACRKRHERLMERRNANDYDTRKMEAIAREYMQMRRELWAPLALKTGEKWTVVEQRVMASGLKNLQATARSAGRRQRLESGYSVQYGVGVGVGAGVGVGGLPTVSSMHASFGIPGVDAGDDDDDDDSADLLDDSSPSGSTSAAGTSAAGASRSVSGASSASTASSMRRPQSQSHSHSHSHSSHTHSHSSHSLSHTSHSQSHPYYTQPQHTHPASAADYYAASNFSQTLRAEPTMSSPYAHQHQAHHQQPSQAQQAHHARMSNADMGIGALLRR